MSQCGPVNPCPACREVYARDPRWVPDEGAPGSYRIATDQDRRKRRPAVPVTAVVSELRLPAPSPSKRQTKRRRRAKQRRKS